MSKHGKVPSGPPKHNLGQLRYLISQIEKRLIDRAEDSEDVELLARCKYWLTVESSSHWSILNSGGDAKEELAKIKSGGNTIVMDYNLGPGFGNQV